MATNKFPNELMEQLSHFRHKYKGRVKFDEVDMLGITHNLKYLYWLEWARLDYLNAIGFTKDPANFILKNPLITVHNEIDYITSSHFNDEYTVYSRICIIKNSSLTFENLITLDYNILLVKASSTLVNVNPKTGESIRINDSIRELIRNYEISEIEFQD